MKQRGIYKRRAVSLRWVAMLLSLFSLALVGRAQELRPGVWAGRDLSAFSLPVTGYQVYMLGELHGVRETEDALMQYMATLYERGGLRDVALEEKSAYQRDAQQYVEGKLNTLPEALCLRTAIFEAIRRFNEGRKGSDLVHVDLVDIDLNAKAIRDHLLTLTSQIQGASTVSVPALDLIEAQGSKTVAALERLTTDRDIRGELRTIGHSIRAHRQGLDVGTAEVKGSPYLDDREDATVSNIIDVLHRGHGSPVLVLYGNDHVSKTLLNNGGPRQESRFEPLALRLERTGNKVFSVVTIPLTGSSSWRGHEREVMWTSIDGGLSSGENLSAVLASSPGSTLLYIDPTKEAVKLPSYDLTRSHADAFLLFAHGTPAANRCAVPRAKLPH